MHILVYIFTLSNFFNKKHFRCFIYTTKNINFSKTFCLPSFSHILGHLKIIAFQNDVFGRFYFFMLHP